MTRAVLEGVALGLLDSMQLIRAAGLGEIRQVRISGGGAKSPFWRKILADVMETELVVVNTTEGAAYGAALLAGVGAGYWRDTQEACNQTVKVLELTSPDEEASAGYREAHQLYRALYPALKPTFTALT
jgi:xylulokinase